MLVIAHRGARAVAPENTLAAIEAAALLGADAVEIDVQLSADDRVVVTHDDTLVRCTDATTRHPDRAPWWVSDFTYAELRSLDAGSWFVDELERRPGDRQAFLRPLQENEAAALIDDDARARYASGTISIPTLDECIALCVRLGLGLNIELKTIPRKRPGLEERVVDAIDRRGLRHQALVSSFDHHALARVRSLDREVRIGVLVRERLFDPRTYIEALDADAWHPGCRGDDDVIGLQSIDGVVDTDTIARMRERDLGVNVWTVNDPDEMRRLIDAGVTGIFTDYPHRLRALLDARRTPGDTT